MDTASSRPPAPATQTPCPSQAVLEVLANKWTTLVLCALESGELRFGELRRRVQGVTQKMLTQTLRTLERDGLVTRTVYPTRHKRRYRLTELGLSAAGLHDKIVAWAVEHSTEILTPPDLRGATGRHIRPRDRLRGWGLNPSAPSSSCLRVRASGSGQRCAGGFQRDASAEHRVRRGDGRGMRRRPRR